MARLVFNKTNLDQLKDGLIALCDLFGVVLETPFEHLTYFSHDDVIERLAKINQEKWWPIRQIFLLDPFYGYCKGQFTENEQNSTGKILLDFVGVFDQINIDLENKLAHYQNIVKTLDQEKTDLQTSITKIENLLREERSLTSQEKMELKAAKGSLIFWEELVKSKNERIAELQRQQNVQLWERERERIFADYQNRIKDLEKLLAEQRKQNENLAKRVSNMGESNRVLKMRHDLAKGELPLASTKNNEDLRRSIYLLEKDVIFLEQQLHTQQRTFATVLCGLKTDLLIISDHMTNLTTSQEKNREFVRVCKIISDIFKAMLEGDLIETLKSLPPHYTYLPSEFKVSRVKRLSRSRLTPLPDPATTERPPATFTEEKKEIVKETVEREEDSVVENPRLVDQVTRTINSTRCMQYFPHMSQDSVKEHWAKFKEFDVDGNESLDFSEVVKALTSMGFQFTAQQAEEAMVEADVNKNRTLDFYEYLIVSDKLFSKKGHAELFHTGAAKENRKVIAKTCVIQ